MGASAGCANADNWRGLQLFRIVHTMPQAAPQAHWGGHIELSQMGQPRLHYVYLPPSAKTVV